MRKDFGRKIAITVMAATLLLGGAATKPVYAGEYDISYGDVVENVEEDSSRQALQVANEDINSVIINTGNLVNILKHSEVSYKQYLTWIAEKQPWTLTVRVPFVNGTERYCASDWEMTVEVSDMESAAVALEELKWLWAQENFRFAFRYEAGEWDVRDEYSIKFRDEFDKDLKYEPAKTLTTFTIYNEDGDVLEHGRLFFNLVYAEDEVKPWVLIQEKNGKEKSSRIYGIEGIYVETYNDALAEINELITQFVSEEVDDELLNTSSNYAEDLLEKAKSSLITFETEKTLYVLKLDFEYEDAQYPWLLMDEGEVEGMDNTFLSRYFKTNVLVENRDAAANYVTNVIGQFKDYIDTQYDENCRIVYTNNVHRELSFQGEYAWLSYSIYDVDNILVENGSLCFEFFYQNPEKLPWILENQGATRKDGRTTYEYFYVIDKAEPTLEATMETIELFMSKLSFADSYSIKLDNISNAIKAGKLKLYYEVFEGKELTEHGNLVFYYENETNWEFVDEYEENGVIYRDFQTTLEVDDVDTAIEMAEELADEFADEEFSKLEYGNQISYKMSDVKSSIKNGRKAGYVSYNVKEDGVLKHVVYLKFNLKY